jgi:hypothetical protein
MKKPLFLMMLVLAVLTTACEKSTLSGTSNDVIGRRGADDPTLPPPANLPAAVLNAFTAQFPGATRMEWQAEDGNTWKVKFFLGAERWIAVYNADGSRISLQQKN